MIRSRPQNRFKSIYIFYKFPIKKVFIFPFWELRLVRFYTYLITQFSYITIPLKKRREIRRENNLQRWVRNWLILGLGVGQFHGGIFVLISILFWNLRILTWVWKPPIPTDYTITSKFNIYRYILTFQKQINKYIYISSTTYMEGDFYFTTCGMGGFELQASWIIPVELRSYWLERKFKLDIKFLFNVFRMTF